MPIHVFAGDGFPVQQNDFCRPGAQKSVGRFPSGIKTVEAQSDVTLVKGLVVGVRCFVVVTEHPELCLRASIGEVVDAGCQQCLARTTLTGKFHHMTRIALTCLRLLQGRNQCTGFGIPFRQPLQQGLAMGKTFRLPCDGVLAEGNITPSWIGVKSIILANMEDQIAGSAVIDTH